MFQLFLFLHVFGAIVVFGPAFVLPLIAAQAARSPQHGHFAAQLSETIELKIVLPGAIVQGITGLGLILLDGLDLTAPGGRYMIVAIALYLVAIGFAIAVQGPAAKRMVRLTGAMIGPPPGGASMRPPSEMAATARLLARGGMFLTILIVIIVWLMVLEPVLGG